MNNIIDYEKLFPNVKDKNFNDLRQAQMVMLRILKVTDYICKKHNINYWLDGGTLLGAVRHKGFIPWDDDIDIGMLRKDYNKFIEVCKYELPNSIFLQTRSSEINNKYYNITVPLKLRDNNSLFVENSENENAEYNQGIFIDIFAYDYLPSNKFKRNWIKRISRRLNKLLRYKVAAKEEFKKNISYLLLSPFFSIKSLFDYQEKIIKNVNSENKSIIGFGLDSNLKRIYQEKEFFPLIEIEFEDSKFLAPRNYDYYLKKTYGDYMKLPSEKDREPKHCKVLIPFLKTVGI